MASALKRFFISYCLALLAIAGVVTNLLLLLQPYAYNMWQRWFGQPEVCSCSTYAVLPSGPGGFILAATLLVGISLLGAMLFRLTLSVLASRALASRFQQNIKATTRFKGLPVHLVESEQPLAVCVGFTEPAIYISTTMQWQMSGFELAAILQHEAEHALQFHPIQRLLLQAMPSWLPWWNRQVEHYVAGQEIVADEAVSDKLSLRTAFIKLVAAPKPIAALAGTTWFSTNQARVDNWLGERVILPSWKLIVGTFIISAGVLLSSYSSFAAEPESVAFGQCLQVQTMCKQVMSYNYDHVVPKFR